MKHLFLFVAFFLLCSACKKEDSPRNIEVWVQTLSTIDQEILDTKVDGEFMYLITKDKFYSIKAGVIQESRDLYTPINADHTHPVIGEKFIYRTLNEDSIVNLEFQPIAPGGNTVLFDIAQLGDDFFILPATRSELVTAGASYDENSFLFAGIGSPALERFLATFKIHYDTNQNIIDSVEFVERKNLGYTLGGNPQLIFDFYTCEDVIYIKSEDGYYKFENESLNFIEEQIFGITCLDDHCYRLNTNYAIERKSTNGEWEEVGKSLSYVNFIESSGDYFLEMDRNNIFLRDDNIQDLGIRLQPKDIGMELSSFTFIEFFENQYFLGVLNQSGEYAIYTRSDLR